MAFEPLGASPGGAAVVEEEEEEEEASSAKLDTNFVVSDTSPYTYDMRCWGKVRHL